FRRDCECEHRMRWAPTTRFLSPRTARTENLAASPQRSHMHFRRQQSAFRVREGRSKICAAKGGSSRSLRDQLRLCLLLPGTDGPASVRYQAWEKDFV